MPLAHNDWTAIASRPRATLRGQLKWSELPDAVFRISDAKALAESGQLLLANRHTEDAVFLVVRPSATSTL